jgi:hypothetical protein
VSDAGVDPVLAGWCQHHLGSAAVEQFFGADHLSAVHGLRLADGRAVVLKVRGADARLVACTIVQRAVWQAGVWCPEPLAGPSWLSPEHPDTWVSAETWEGGGERRPRADPPVAYAGVLAAIVAVAPQPQTLPTLSPTVPWLGYDHDAPGRVWPPAASERWDPHRIERELPPVIVDVARRARLRLLAADAARLVLVVGHGDLSGLNARWFTAGSGVERCLVHDWDSVVAAPEAVLAGNAAADHASDDRSRLAPIGDTARFLDAYADARRRAWSPEETQIAWAAGAWVAAYNAAFEHLKGGPGPVTERLLEDGRERIARAGGPRL